VSEEQGGGPQGRRPGALTEPDPMSFLVLDRLPSPARGKSKGRKEEGTTVPARAGSVPL